MAFLHILTYLGLPALLLLLEKRVRWIEWIGPVVLCYGLGIALGNIPGWQEQVALGETVYQAAAVLAIPLVLFSANLVAWARLAKNTLLSFAFASLAACISALVAFYGVGNQLTDPEALTGMAVGVYTGGTQNLTAIGIGLGVPADLIAKANLADTVVSALYLLLVLSILPGFLRRLLPTYSPKEQSPTTEPTQNRDQGAWLHTLYGIGLAIVCLGVSFGMAQLIPLSEKGPIIISSVTLLGLLCSLYPPIRSLPGTFATGEYLLLVFCVAIGAQINLELITVDVIPLLVFFLIGAYLAILLHLAFVYLAKIDADTFLITSVAGIFNPIFIAPVARKLGNREIIAPGMTAAIVGYAIGNFLGLGLSLFLSSP